jgi:hypothetical protein
MAPPSIPYSLKTQRVSYTLPTPGTPQGTFKLALAGGDLSGVFHAPGLAPIGGSNCAFDLHPGDTFLTISFYPSTACTLPSTSVSPREFISFAGLSLRVGTPFPP